MTCAFIGSICGIVCGVIAFFLCEAFFVEEDDRPADRRMFSDEPEDFGPPLKSVERALEFKDGEAAPH
ncbi:hypothetical protein [Mesorhizobium sp. B2-4-6]|uniref:hypothetical protein n=1 Tax=Mesorhizobium sp. B2-4-6 TaxID=2589943 RepID=UPI00112D8840|nr:hypothetical protein [Mesorhizobium sp. B2-4-6]TPL40165.1 hypothetical protein FJ957_27050 [Mesorhizobium sp. B2-4-6]